MKSGTKIHSSAIYGALTWMVLCIFVSSVLFAVPLFDVLKYVTHIFIFNCLVGLCALILCNKEIKINCHVLLFATWLGYAITEFLVFISKVYFSGSLVIPVIAAVCSTVYLLVKIRKSGGLIKDTDGRFLGITTTLVLSSTLFYAFSTIGKNHADINMLLGTGTIQSHLTYTWPIQHPLVWDVNYSGHYFSFQHLACVSKLWEIPTWLLSTRIYPLCYFPILLLTIQSVTCLLVKNKYVSLVILLQLGFVYQHLEFITNWCGHALAIVTFRSYTGISAIGFFMVSWGLILNLYKFKFAPILKIGLLFLFTFIATGSRGPSGIMIGVIAGGLILITIIRHRKIRVVECVQFSLIFLAWLAAMRIFYHLGGSGGGLGWIKSGFSLESSKHLSSTKYIGSFGAIVFCMVFYSTFLVVFLFGTINRAILEVGFRKILIITILCLFSSIVLFHFVYSGGGSEFKFVFYGQLALGILLVAGIEHIPKKIRTPSYIIGTVLCLAQIGHSVYTFNYCFTHGGKFGEEGRLGWRISSSYNYSLTEGVDVVEFLRDNYVSDRVYICIASPAYRLEASLAARCPGIKLYGSKRHISMAVRNSKRLSLFHKLTKKFETGENFSDSLKQIESHIGYPVSVIAPLDLIVDDKDFQEIFRNSKFKIIEQAPINK